MSERLASFVGFATNSAKDGEKVAFAFISNCKDSTIAEEHRNVMMQSVLDDVVYPEVFKLIKEGKLEANFGLRRAHILLYSDKSRNEILLNDNVRIKSLVKFKTSNKFSVGDAVHEEDIEDILGLFPNDKNDPNAAHIMLIKLVNRWYFAFDLIYDRERIRKRFETAKLFFQVSNHCFEQKLWGPLADNLFSSTELTIQSILLLHHNPKFSLNQSHEDTEKLFNSYAENGNVDVSFAKNYTKLFELRKQGRYLTGVHKKEFSVEESEAKEYLETTKKTIEFADSLFQRINFSRNAPFGEYIDFGISK